MDNSRYLYNFAVMLRTMRAVFRPVLYLAMPVATLVLHLSDVEGKFFFAMVSIGAIVSKFYLMYAERYLGIKLNLIVFCCLYLVGSVFVMIGNASGFLLGGVLLGLAMGGFMPMSNVLSKLTATSASHTVKKQSVMGMASQALSIVTLLGAGYITSYAGWRVTILILVLGGILLVAMSFFLRFNEVSSVEVERKLTFNEIKSLVMDRCFVSLALIYSFAAVYLHLALVFVPFYFIHYVGLSAHYCAWLIMPSSACGILGRVFCYYINTRISFFFYNCFLVVIIAVSLALFYITPMVPDEQFALIAMAMGVLGLGYGMLTPYIQAVVSNNYERVLTQAASLLSFSSSVVFLITLIVIAAIPSSSLLPLAVLLSCVYVIMVVAQVVASYQLSKNQRA